MLFRRSASLVEAILFDGTEAAIRAVLAIPRAAAITRAGEVELATHQGRRVARNGSWITRDTVTNSIKLYEDGLFHARHEAVL